MYGLIKWALALPALLGCASVAWAQPADVAEVAGQVAKIWAAEEAPGLDDVADLLERRLVVLEALRSEALWPEQTAGTHRWTLPAASGQTQEVLVRIPRGYTRKQAWPLVIGLHGTGGNAAGQMGMTERLLQAGGVLEQAIVVCPESVQPGPFAGTPVEIGQAVAMLPALSRRLRLDRDRVRVTGYSKGGHASFANAVLHGEWYASSLPMAGTWTVGPFWLATATCLLPNLSGQTMHVVYGENDLGRHGMGTRTPSGPKKLRGIGPVNRKIQELFASRMWKRKFPGLTSVGFQELKGQGHGGNWPGEAQLKAWLAAKRPAQGARKGERTRRWRFVAESWLDGVRVSRLDGKPFDRRARVALRPKRGQSGEDALADHMAKRYGFTSTKWSKAGNRLDLKVHRGREIEVWLNAETFDFAKPVLIKLGRKTAFKGLVKPDPLQLMHWLRLTGDTSRAMEVRILIRGTKGVLNPSVAPTPLAVYP